MLHSSCFLSLCSWLYDAASPIAGSVWQMGNNATASGDYIVNTLSAVANSLANPSAVVVSPPKSQNHYHRIVVPTTTTTTACNAAKITASLASSIPTFTFAPEQSCMTQSSTCSYCYVNLLGNTLGTCAA
jgi:hypothetical protein